MLNSMGQAGAFVAPPLFGILKDTTGSYELGMLLLAPCSLVSVMLLFVIRGRSARRAAAFALI